MRGGETEQGVLVLTLLLGERVVVETSDRFLGEVEIVLPHGRPVPVNVNREAQEMAPRNRLTA